MPTTPPSLEVDLSLTLPSRLLRVLRRKLHTLRVAWQTDGLDGVLAASRAKLRHSIITRTGWIPPSGRRQAPSASFKLRDVPPSGTLISVILPVHNPPARMLEECLDSVLTQTHEAWQLCICDDYSTQADALAVLARYAGLDQRVTVVRPASNLGISGAANLAAQRATGAFLAFLDHDDELHPQALAEIAAAVDGDPLIDIVYSDEDLLGADGSLVEPVRKPDWSPEFLHTCNYVLHCFCIRATLFRQLGGLRSQHDGAQDWDLTLRAAPLARRVHHIPRILYHWRTWAGSTASGRSAKPYGLDAGQRALEEAAAALVPPATVDHGLLPETFRLRRDPEQRPPVTLLILSADSVSEVRGRGRLRILANFLRSISARSTYPDYTILVVGDGEISTESAELLEACGGRSISLPREDGSAYSFARHVNFAVGCVQTEHFVLLHDDLEVISADWIEALMDYAVVPEVAAVGGRLLFADGSTQHAGVIGRPGGPEHIFYRLPKGEIGYHGFSHVVRNYAAVTAAVLAGKRSVFRDVGPFDEALAHDFSDVDFCLRAGSRGYRVVYTPFCELYHFEHASLGRAAPRRAALSLFLERWHAWAECDPFFRPL